jgi:hypothetical protein
VSVNEHGELYFSIDIIHPCPRALKEDDGNCPLFRKGLVGYTTRTKTPNQRATTTTTRLIKKETKSPSALSKTRKSVVHLSLLLVAGCFVTVFLQYKHKHAHLELLVATSLTEGNVVSQGSSGEREPCPENRVFARAIFQTRPGKQAMPSSNAVLPFCFATRAAVFCPNVAAGRIGNARHGECKNNVLSCRGGELCQPLHFWVSSVNSPPCPHSALMRRRTCLASMCELHVHATKASHALPLLHHKHISIQVDPR